MKDQNKVRVKSRARKELPSRNVTLTSPNITKRKRPLEYGPDASIQKKCPRLRLILSPPSLQQLAEDLPTDLLVWSLLRKVLLSGKLRSVNPYDIGSINPQHCFGQCDLNVPKMLRHRPFKEAMSAQEITHLVLEDMLSKGSQEVGTSVNHSYRPHAPEIASKVVSFAASPTDPCDVNPIWHVEIPCLAARYDPPTIYKSLEQADEVLEEQNILANISPYGCVADLHHDVGFGSSTLVQGEKLWFLYPPSDANLKVLRSAYKLHTRGMGGDLIFKCYRKLQDGVAFVQSAGTTVWVTPYCPHAVFTLKSSIMLFGPEKYVQGTIPQRLRNVDTDLALRGALHSGKDKEIEELLRHLAAVLMTDNVKLQRRTIEAWDIFNRDIMKKALKGSTYRSLDFKEVWNVCTAHWEDCPSCDKTQRETAEEQEGKGRSRKTWFQKHFEDVHWRS